MTNATISALEEIMREVFDAPDLLINKQTNAADVEGWDSLSHLYLLSAVEEHFGIRFELAQIAQLKNVGQLADLIDAKTHNQQH